MDLDHSPKDAEDNKMNGLNPESDFTNPKILENWVDDILKDAEVIGIPTKFFKNSQIRPSVMYGIDRDTLKFLGITEINIDRLYRALFVYSIGFYELISLITSGIKSKDQSKHSQIIGAVWTVYSILLEFWCKADYKLLISQIAVDYENEKQKLKNIIEK